MQKLGKATFGALISILVIVLLTSAGTAVPYMESNSQSENLETHQQEQFKDKIKSLLSTIENKEHMTDANPGNITLLQLLRIIMAWILVIPSMIIMTLLMTIVTLGTIPMMIIMIPMTMIMLMVTPFVFIASACLEVILSDGEIGLIKAFMTAWSDFWNTFRDIVNPDNVYPKNFLMLDSICING